MVFAMNNISELGGERCQVLNEVLIDWEAAKTRVLSVLKQREERGEPGLGNAKIRQITNFDRNQVVRLMIGLRPENPGIQPPGRSRCRKGKSCTDQLLVRIAIKMTDP